MPNNTIPVSAPFLEVSPDPDGVDGVYVISRAKTKPLKQLDLPKEKEPFNWQFSEIVDFYGTINKETLVLDLYLKFGGVTVHHWNKILTNRLVLKSYFGTFKFFIKNPQGQHQLWGSGKVGDQPIVEKDLVNWLAVEE